MKTGLSSNSIISIVVMAFTTIGLSYPDPAHSCGLEHSINGGFTISYPGSLEVAVAVANARSDGLLPAASTAPIPNDVHRQRLIADLRRLQVRFNKSRDQVPAVSTASFSLVLVGPGLWSHFHITKGGVLANYHTDGPIAEKAIVLTHSAVLRALLDNELNIEQASRLGLIAYSGANTLAVQRTFETSLQVKT